MTTNKSALKPPSTHHHHVSSQNFWLMKSEPFNSNPKLQFSIDDLADMPNDQTSPWDGVRNYEARNLMRDKMKLFDLVLFYHSNCKPPGIVGVARVVREGYVDHTAFDRTHPHYDPKSDPSMPPKWFMVDVQFVEKFERMISLDELKTHKNGALEHMALLNNRSRLSVQPVKASEFQFILSLN